MMKSDERVTGPINLGAKHECTMLELSEKIIQLTQSKSKLIFKQLPEDDPKERQPDLTNAKQLLGWKPQVTLESGLMKTIEYFKGVIAT